ncbi:glycosyltransferase [Arthrobacter globiformis]|uniref:glycosyltransferase n=1 Tax=Arthrobacter globiformis TaxID=1665 RepID=UPI003979A859
MSTPNCSHARNPRTVEHMAKPDELESQSLVIWSSPSTKGAGAYQLWENYSLPLSKVINRVMLLRGHTEYDSVSNPQANLNLKSIFWSLTKFRSLLGDASTTHVITSISQSDILYGLFVRPFSRSRWTIYVLGQPYPVKNQTGKLKSLIWKRLWILAAKRSDQIIGVSEYISALISKEIPGRQITTVYPSLLNPSRLAQCEQSSEPPIRVGFVGRLSVEKDPGLFCDIVEDFDEVEGLVFGDGLLRESLAERTERISFLGFTPQDQIYPNVDVLMMTSRSEGLPMVLVEASHAGVVPLVADVGGCAEAIHPDNRDLLVIPRGEREHVAVWRERLRLLLSPVLRDAVLRRQREWADRNFDVGANSRLLAELAVPEV